MNFNAVSIAPRARQCAKVEPSAESWKISVVQVPSGVAEGRSRSLTGNATMELWTLFVSRERFEACALSDPMRFSDPLRFAQLRREFEHVFSQPDSHRLHPRPRLHG